MDQESKYMLPAPVTKLYYYYDFIEEPFLDSIGLGAKVHLVTNRNILKNPSNTMYLLMIPETTDFITIKQSLNNYLVAATSNWKDICLKRRGVLVFRGTSPASEPIVLL